MTRATDLPEIRGRLRPGDAYCGDCDVVVRREERAEPAPAERGA
jgi:hypothetical protein